MLFNLFLETSSFKTLFMRPSLGTIWVAFQGINSSWVKYGDLELKQEHGKINYPCPTQTPENGPQPHIHVGGIKLIVHAQQIDIIDPHDTLVIDIHHLLVKDIAAQGKIAFGHLIGEFDLLPVILRRIFFFDSR